MNRTLTKIPPHVSFRLRYLFQGKGVRGKESLKLYPDYSRASVYRHVVKSIDSTQVVDKCQFNKRRPNKFGSFAIKWLQLVSGLVNKVCDENVRNLLKNKGYKFLHSRKKGLLKAKDLKERLKFSRKIKRVFKKNIWRKETSFYLDGVGYQHKYNPFDETKSVKA